MKHKQFSPQTEPTSAAPKTKAASLDQNAIDFAPAPDAVARRAYFSYESQGSVPGNHVQHWLAAESALIAERKLSLGSRSA